MPPRATKAAAPAAGKSSAASKRAAASTASASASAAASTSARPSRAARKQAIVEAASDAEEEEEEEEEKSDEDETMSASEVEEEEEEEKKTPAPAPKKQTKKTAAAASTAPVAVAAAAPAKAPAKRVTKKAAAAAASVVPVAAASGPGMALHAQLASLLTEVSASFTRHASLAAQAASLLAKDPSAFQASFLAHAAFVCAKSGRRQAGVMRCLEWMGRVVARAFSAPEAASSKDKTNADAQLRFAEEVLQALLDWASSAKDKVVRARSCRLFGEVMARLAESEDDAVADFLFERAEKALLQACRDKQDSVRVEAARAMRRLQADAVEAGSSCPVTNEYVRLMRFDPCKDVRRVAVEFVDATGHPEAIGALLARTQDIDPGVRQAVFKTLARKVHPKQLPIAERARLIRQGFQDRAPEVAKAARALVLGQPSSIRTNTRNNEEVDAVSWLQSKDNDLVRLLRSLEVETFPEESLAVLKHAFKTRLHMQRISNNDDDAVEEEEGAMATLLPPYAPEELTSERALLWRALGEHLYSESASLRSKGLGVPPQLEAELEQVLPDTVELCAALEAHVGDAFITAQLLGLALVSVDLADEAGRRSLGALVEQQLRDIASSQQNIPLLMKVYRLVHTTENNSQGGVFSLEADNSFIRVVLELLSDIRDPLEHHAVVSSKQQLHAEEDKVELEAQRALLDQRYEQLRADMEKLQVQKQAAINAENYAAAEQIKSQLTVLCAEFERVEHELNSAGFQDDATWARLLSIVCDLLEQTRRAQLHGGSLSGHGNNNAAAGVHDDAGLSGLLESTIWPGIHSEHVQVQSLGLKALSLYSLLDRATASGALTMFLAAAQTAETLVQRATAMRALTDVLMMFEDIMQPSSPPSADATAEEIEAGKASAEQLQADVTALFLTQIELSAHGVDAKEEGEVCVMGVECLAKLLLFDRLAITTDILSLLLFIFFHPATDTRSTQCLAVFFPAFLLVNAQKHANAFLDAMLPALRLLHTAASTSAASSSSTEEEGDVWRGFNLQTAWKAMVSFLSSAPTSVRSGPGNLWCAQQALAIELAHQLLAFPEVTMAAHFVQALAALSLPAATPAPITAANAAAPTAVVVAEDEDAENAEAAVVVAPPAFHLALMHLLEQVGSSLRDKSAQKDLAKFVTSFAKSVAEQLAGIEAGEMSAEQIDMVENAATERVEQLHEAHEAEAAALAEAQATAAALEEEEAPKKKKTAAAVKAAPAKGKRALKAKTPSKARPAAKKRTATKDDSSSDDDDSSAEEEDEESRDESDSEEEGFKISKAAKKPAVAAKKVTPARAAPLPLGSSIASLQTSAAAAAKTSLAKPAPAAAAVVPTSARPGRASKAHAQTKLKQTAATADSSEEEDEDDDKEEEEEAEMEQENIRA